MTFWASCSMIGNDSCALAIPTCSSTDTNANREKRRIIAVSFLTRLPPPRFLLVHGLRSSPRPLYAPRALRCLHVRQDAADERQQLFRRVEVRHLPCDDMLDTPVPG